VDRIEIVHQSRQRLTQTNTRVYRGRTSISLDANLD